MRQPTMYDYEEELNAMSPDAGSGEWWIGGVNRWDDYDGRWGTAIRRYDPIRFNVGYSEHVRELEYQESQQRRSS